jgi:hypothetical protein
MHAAPIVPVPSCCAVRAAYLQSCSPVAQLLANLSQATCGLLLCSLMIIGRCWPAMHHCVMSHVYSMLAISAHCSGKLCFNVEWWDQLMMTQCDAAGLLRHPSHFSHGAMGVPSESYSIHFLYSNARQRCVGLFLFAVAPKPPHAWPWRSIEAP